MSYLRPNTRHTRGHCTKGRYWLEWLEFEILLFGWVNEDQGHSAKMSFYSGILYAKFFDYGVSHSGTEQGLAASAA
jgi:hypothetical protein